jgi:SNF2 family DNA or RNA helicase
MSSGDGPLRLAIHDDGDCLDIAAVDPTTTRRRLSAAVPGLRGRRQAGRVTLTWAEATALFASGEPVEATAEASRAVMARESIRSAAPAVLSRLASLRDAPLEQVRTAVTGSTLLDVLDDHQLRNVAAMTVPGGWGTCVFDEQGTGKTVTLITAFDLLVERNEADVLLVVAPKSMIGEWAAEFRRFTHDLYKVVVADGDRHQKAHALRVGADIVVVNYETTVSLADQLVLLARRCRLVLGVDESYNVKNPHAARTQALRRLREHCGRTYVLCGTPAPNSATDLISQFDLVDLGLTFGGVIPDRDRDTAAKQVAGVLRDRGHYLRNLKNDVLDLPGRTFTDLPVTLAPRQRRAYDAALTDLVLDLRNTSDQEYTSRITSYLERRSALLRICSDPSPLVSGYDETPAKIATLDTLLTDLISRDEKVILWSFYRHSLDQLAGRYTEFGLVRVDGSVPAPERRDAVSRFQDDPRVRIFLGNPAAAGAGLTLHTARVAVYESMSNQAAHFMQSLDRIHRRGQHRPVEYITLLAQDTLETVEYRRLLRKADAQADLLGDCPEPRPTREMLLDELLAAHAGSNHERRVVLL